MKPCYTFKIIHWFLAFLLFLVPFHAIYRSSSADRRFNYKGEVISVKLINNPPKNHSNRKSWYFFHVTYKTPDGKILDNSNLMDRSWEYDEGCGCNPRYASFTFQCKSNTTPTDKNYVALDWDVNNDYKKIIQQLYNGKYYNYSLWKDPFMSLVFGMIWMLFLIFIPISLENYEPWQVFTFSGLLVFLRLHANEDAIKYYLPKQLKFLGYSKDKIESYMKNL